jgi:hypothetical protein
MCLMFAYEMPLIASVLAVAVRVGGADGAALSLDAIMSYQYLHGPLLLDPVMIPAVLALLVFIPGTMASGLFDIPEAEPEVIEGPLLEYSGPLLAVFNLMSAVKLAVVLQLAVALICPNPLGGSVVVNLAWHVFKCLTLLLVSGPRPDGCAWTRDSRFSSSTHRHWRSSASGWRSCCDRKGSPCSNSCPNSLRAHPGFTGSMPAPVTAATWKWPRRRSSRATMWNAWAANTAGARAMRTWSSFRAR